MAPRLLLACLLSFATTFAQFVPTPSGFTTAEGYAGIQVRYKQIPNGICETNASVKSYTGYADVAENEHIFFWFFESRDVDPTEAPLTVWINGGPGSSSMIGLFQELGPCFVDSNYTVYNNPHSWSKVSNMIFIDQPVTVGFSYSYPVNAYQDTSSSSGDVVTLPDDICPPYAQSYGSCATYSYADIALTSNSTANAAPNMWKTLQGFMGAFPQYSRDGFHFTTESYGGHYGPIFNEYFEQQNAALPPGAMPISLKSVSIGNGWFDPLIQYAAYYNFTVFPGNTYDYSPFTKHQQHKMYNAMYGKGNCHDLVSECASTGRDDVCQFADDFCYDQVEYLLDTAANRDEYDIRELSPDPFPPGFYVSYLNQQNILEAIGAYQNYSEFSYVTGNAFVATGDDDREAGTVEALQKLLAQGVQVTLYFGDADYICNWLGGFVVAGNICAPNWSTSGFVNLTTSDGMVHGQVRQAGTFSFVRFYESGHEVPFYQPLASLEMFERVLNNVDLATGTKLLSPGLLTTGPPTSDYREGNATVQFKVVPTDDTYNTTTGAPNKPPGEKRDLEMHESGAGLAMRMGKRERKVRGRAGRMGWRMR